MTPIICRSFRQDFPQFVAKAEELGLSISLGEGRRRGRSRAFWLDGYKQLTGYTIKSDGRPFQREDEEENIARVLDDIEADRKVMATLSIEERFGRLIAELRQIEPRYRMIGEVRLPGGDRAHCFFMADFEGGAMLYGLGAEIAHARAGWSRGESLAGQMARFCDALESDFHSRRADLRVVGAAGA